MSVVAVVTEIMTRGYAEAAPYENGVLGSDRYIAQIPKKMKVKRGYTVELTPIESAERNITKIFYIIPLIRFIIGFAVTQSQSTGERLLAGLIVGIMGFIIAWIFNRRSRMMHRQEYVIVKVLNKEPVRREYI